MTPTIDGQFGWSVATFEDVGFDGVAKIAVGAPRNNEGGSARGATWVIELDSSGAATTGNRISSFSGNLTGPLANDDRFGSAVASLGDNDGDGQVEIVVGATGDDDGGLDRGALYVLNLACKDSDGDGLCDTGEDANTDTDLNPGTTPGPDTDGDTSPNYQDADDDGDGIATTSEDSDPNNDGHPRDALDADRDGESDYLDAPTIAANGTVATEQKITEGVGGFTATLDPTDYYGTAVASIGDIDGDGINDVAIGSPGDDDGGSGRGAVYVLFLNADGTVKAEQKISDLAGGLTTTLDDADSFGAAIGMLGDIDGDGVNDLAVGATGDDDGGGGRGAVYVLFLNADGTVKAEQKISDLVGGLTATLDNFDVFGYAIGGIGDLDGDGINDLAVGADFDDDGGADRGAVHVLFLNADGTVKAEQKISDTTGGLAATLDDTDYFGSAVASPGDVNGDGRNDLVVGAYWDDDGVANAGAVYVLFLNSDGTVAAEQKISDTAGGLVEPLGADYFGTSAAGIGDVDADGTPDLVIGTTQDDDGAANAGAAYVLFLNPDGTVKAEQKISQTAGGFTGPLASADWLGRGVATVGDLDGDGTIGLLLGAHGDETGGSNAGAVYIVDLTSAACLDSDSDGLCDNEEDANTDADNDASTNPGPDTDGDTTSNYLDNDDDGDGTLTSVENADPNTDGDPRDALDADRDGQPDYLDAPTIPTTADVATEQKVSATNGGLSGPLADGDFLGVSAESVGDIDGDGVTDIVMGASRDDDGGNNRGAIYVVFNNADGSVKAEQKISDTAGGLVATLDNSDGFGVSTAGIGDIDGDGVGDVAVGAMRDDDGGADRGAVFILFLNADGTVKDEQKISDTQGGLAAALADGDFFGRSVGSVGDVDGDGINDVVAGATDDDDGGLGRGAVYVLFLNADGTVKAEQKISDTTGGLSAALLDGNMFGRTLAGLGDLDSDGTPDIVVGVNVGRRWWYRSRCCLRLAAEQRWHGEGRAEDLVNLRWSHLDHR